jgi:mono/diheme cytochrome c family protein
MRDLIFRPGTLRSVVAGFVLVFATSACHPVDNAMVAVFGRSMRSQPSFDPYENQVQNEVLPPEGSVPFAAGNFPAAPGQINNGQPEGVAIPMPITQADLINQNPVVVDLANPLAADAGSLARGEEVFVRACAPCHGTGGAGDGPVTQAGMLPMSLLTNQATGYSDGYVYGIIRVGRGLMPAYGHQITHFDRWNVVNYVRSLQAAVPAGDE